MAQSPGQAKFSAHLLQICFFKQSTKERSTMITNLPTDISADKYRFQSFRKLLKMLLLENAQGLDIKKPSKKTK